MNINSAFPSDYLKAADLNGKAVRVTIESVDIVKVGDDQKPVLRFAGKDRGLILNKTNAARIVEATSSDETDDWTGWSIVLYPTKVDYAGKRVDAIRIDDRPGATKRPATAVAPRVVRPRADQTGPEDYEELPESDLPDDSGIPF